MAFGTEEGGTQWPSAMKIYRRREVRHWPQAGASRTLRGHRPEYVDAELDGDAAADARSRVARRERRHCVRARDRPRFRGDHSPRRATGTRCSSWKAGRSSRKPSSRAAAASRCSMRRCSVRAWPSASPLSPLCRSARDARRGRSRGGAGLRRPLVGRPNSPAADQAAGRRRRALVDRVRYGAALCSCVRSPRTTRRPKRRLRRAEFRSGLWQRRPRGCGGAARHRHRRQPARVVRRSRRARRDARRPPSSPRLRRRPRSSLPSTMRRPRSRAGRPARRARRRQRARSLSRDSCAGTFGPSCARWRFVRGRDVVRARRGSAARRLARDRGRGARSRPARRSREQSARVSRCAARARVGGACAPPAAPPARLRRPPPLRHRARERAEPRHGPVAPRPALESPPATVRARTSIARRSSILPIRASQHCGRTSPRR